MSDLDLEAIKARCAAATPGEWRWMCVSLPGIGRGPFDVAWLLHDGRTNDDGYAAGAVVLRHQAATWVPVRSDRDFLAHARTDVPALVAEVERLREIKCDKVDCDRVEKDRREALARAETAEAEVARLTAQKDNAYNERDRCVSVIACLARALGWPVWLGTHEGDPWDEEWRNIVFIETPHGQVSWHYHDSERPMFSWIGLGMPTPKPWDGHSTPEKYNLLFGLVHDGIPNVQAEVERLREERGDQASLVEVFEDEAKRLRSDLAECYRITGADPDGDDDAMLARKAVAAVKRLREESDTEAETADKRIAELEAAVSDAMVVIADMAPGETVLIDRLRSLLAKGGAA